LRVTYELGRALDKAGDKNGAFEQYLEAAQKGYSKAMVVLSLMYLEGTVLKDDVASTQWLQRAADAGNSEAMSELSLRYLAGKGKASGVDRMQIIRIDPNA
jgi:uncharacterized protein